MKTVTLTISACIPLAWDGLLLVWGDAVTDWNANAGKAAIASCIDGFPRIVDMDGMNAHCDPRCTERD